jgi:two-component system, NarL family, response regulator DesR
MIRIVIAEDQELMLGTIGSLLNLEDDMEVVGLASNGEEALALVHRLQPDVCIMDLEMPKKSGLEAAESLKSFECNVMILTTFAKAGNFERVVSADIRGYLLKDSPSEELACSIRSIMNGTRIYSPELMDDASSDKLEVELLARDQIPNITPIEQRNTSETVKSYFSILMDKMKLPTG